MVEDRAVEPVARWLLDHPGVQVISRDRAEAYAQAARKGAPDAIQVADRFHLVRNVYDALKKLMRSRRWDVTVSDTDPVVSPGDLESMDARRSHPPASKQSLWQAVQQYKQQGIGIRPIAKKLGIHRETVRKYMAADSPPTYNRYAPRHTKLTPFLPYLQKRWDSGHHNARRLYNELREQGYSGKYTQVKDTVRPWRTTDNVPPPTRRIELWPLLLPSHHKLDGDQRKNLVRVLAANPILARGYALKERFLRLALMSWTSGLPRPTIVE
jgi:hypothetical protein